MVSKFLNIDRKKQTRILNAAMKEFALKGYTNASTNAIVKEAGISKGLLFHYFTNKKDLYSFLTQHTITIIMDEFLNGINLSEKDIFQRLKDASQLKMKLLMQYPDIIKFLISIQVETASEVIDDIREITKQMRELGMDKLYQDFDVTLFREDIDIGKALNIINWSLEGYSEQMLQKIKLTGKQDLDFSEAFDEVDQYIDILKTSFYK
ncbi:TetR/AcrR family transcriptional regulator [Bacillus sp. HMF5848]|uniref:TetR/AcrR family transcriptional regulator n=1 Tax=Bacillus sp. HMF5848 TaxID=2495421 RepID=UPI000F7975D0|nr:TetR/AcrR family transcriptional regulator [Bacillus sp. HMF5848]RSK26045.1 TetR/AcrR family transcriptional regulator [Bacillus sp. HMF5848]